MNKAILKGKMEFLENGDSVAYYHIEYEGLNYIVKDSLAHNSIYSMECEFEKSDNATFKALRKVIDSN